MVERIPIAKIIWWYIKYRLRYLRFKHKYINLSEPQLVYGLTDHPLDQFGQPIIDIFSAVYKFLARTPRSILHVKLKSREKNSFAFQSFAYDIRVHKRNIKIAYIEYYTAPKNKVKECTLQLDLLNSSSYRVRLAFGPEIPPHLTPMVCGDITEENLEVTLQEVDDRYVIATPLLRLHIIKSPFKIQVFDKEGNIVTTSGSRSHSENPAATDTFPLGFVKNRSPKRWYAVENFDLSPNEAIFGFGEKFGALNKMGQTITIWTMESTNTTTFRGYKQVPFFFSSRGYGVFFNESRPLTFWVGSREVTKIMVAAEGTLVDYYFFYGPEPKQVLAQYTALTGRARTPPRWSFGAWMSRLSYGSQEEVLAVARRLRAEKYPFDVIHIDTNWYEQEWFCNWQFDPTKFPDAGKMFRECADMGFKISLWQYPYVLDCLPLAKDAKKKNALAKNHGPFIFLHLSPAHVIDLSRPEGVAWYQARLQALFTLGAKVIKADFGEQIEAHQEFAAGDGRLMHNLFPLLYNKAAFEAAERSFGPGQAIIWARSAYAGSQRYPVHWGGDNASNFQNLYSSVRGGLSFGMCGFTFWSQDVGGFVGIPDDKLYARWTAESIFQSHIRFHGCMPKFREPWNFSPEAQAAVRTLLEFRYRLIPYIFSEGIKSAQSGFPLMRALFLEFPNDPFCFHVEDQFCSGEVLLVAPLFSESDNRRVYLPPGQWYNYWTGVIAEGPAWVDEGPVPWDQIPLFIRAGSFLPLGEVTQFVQAGVPSNLTLLAFPQKGGQAGYTLCDELGSVHFHGVKEVNVFRVDVTYTPADRQRYTFKVQFPRGYPSLSTTIVEKPSS